MSQTAIPNPLPEDFVVFGDHAVGILIFKPPPGRRGASWRAVQHVVLPGSWDEEDRFLLHEVWARDHLRMAQTTLGNVASSWQHYHHPGARPNVSDPQADIDVVLAVLDLRRGKSFVDRDLGMPMATEALLRKMGYPDSAAARADTSQSFSGRLLGAIVDSAAAAYKQFPDVLENPREGAATKLELLHLEQKRLRGRVAHFAESPADTWETEAPNKHELRREQTRGGAEQFERMRALNSPEMWAARRAIAALSREGKTRRQSRRGGPLAPRC